MVRTGSEEINFAHAHVAGVGGKGHVAEEFAKVLAIQLCAMHSKDGKEMTSRSI